MALAQSVTRTNVSQGVIAAARHVDVVADLGRMAAPYDDRKQLLRSAKAVGVLIGPDPTSVAHVVEQREMLSDLCGKRISLMIVGRGTCRARDVENATGLRVSAQVPHDPAAAAVAIRWPRAALADWLDRCSSSRPAVSPIRLQLLTIMPVTIVRPTIVRPPAMTSRARTSDRP